MEYILTPEGLGSEFMNTIRLKVNSIDGGDSVVLGRNETTGLNIPTCPNFQFISRNHIELNVRGDHLYMKCISSQDMVVHLNGVPCDRIERKLDEADLICMLGVRQYFNYRVRCQITLTESPKSTSNLNPLLVDLLDNNTISKQFHNSMGNSTKTVMSILNSAVESSKTIDKTQSYGNETSNIDISSVTVNTAIAVKEVNNNDNINSTTTTTATGMNTTLKTVPSAEDMLKTMVNKLLRQYECSICYETLACAVSLNPCGCCFCYTCIAGWVEDGNKHKPSSSSAAATNPFASFAQCPHCQVEFNLSGTLPNRLVDGAIREILTDLPTELTDWERRVKEGAEKRKEVNDSLNSSTTSSSSHSNMGMTMLTSNSSNSSATSHRTGSRGTINSFFNTTVSPVRPITISRAAPSGRRPFGAQEVVELEDSQPMALRDALNMRREVFMHGSRIERSLNSRRTHSPATAGIMRGTKRGRTEAMNNTTAAPVNVFDLTSQSQNNPFLARSSSSSSTTTTNGVPSTTALSTRHTNRVNLG